MTVWGDLGTADETRVDGTAADWAATEICTTEPDLP